MNYKNVKVNDLSPDPSNVRKHDAKNLEAIKASLLKFGQQKPIVIDSDGLVIAGNGTLQAARDLGWEKLACVNSDLNGVEATAYAIADNRSAELAEWDDDGLATTLAALQNDESFDHLAAGFSDGEITQLIDRVAGDGNPDWKEEWDGMPEFEQEDKTSMHRIIVHFATDKDRDDFAALISQTITDKTQSVWYPEAEIGRIADKRYAG